MRVGEIPFKLYQEFAEEFDGGEEKQVSNHMSIYRVRELADYLNQDYGPAIGYRADPGQSFSVFAFWSRPPNEKNADTVFEPSPLIEIYARNSPLGIWGDSRGRRMQRRLEADFPCKGITVSGTCVPLLLKVLARAHELVQDCGEPIFWEMDEMQRNQGNPSGEFTES